MNLTKCITFFFFKVPEEVGLLAGTVNYFLSAKGNQDSNFVILQNHAEII